MMYYARNINFSELKKNEKIKFNAIVDGKIYNLYGKYLGKETIKNEKEEEIYCSKFSSKIIAGSIFSIDNEIFVWVTNDKNKIPVKIKADILIGSVIVYLSKAENLKY